MIEAIYTTPLGAVRMSRNISAAGDLTAEDFERLIDGIDRQLRTTHAQAVFLPHAAVRLGRNVYDAGRHGDGRQGTDRLAGPRL